MPIRKTGPGRSAAVASSARSKRKQDGRAPEWATERWKHQVEAEARHRLKHEVRDVGAER
jgi:hypothetical protein